MQTTGGNAIHARAETGTPTNQKNLQQIEISIGFADQMQRVSTTMMCNLLTKFCLSDDVEMTNFDAGLLELIVRICRESSFERHPLYNAISASADW